MSTEELAELFEPLKPCGAPPHPNFLFVVNDFAPRFGITDRAQLQEALHILGDKGLVILAGSTLSEGSVQGSPSRGASSWKRVEKQA